MCSGTFGILKSNDKALDGLRVKVTYVGEWRLVVQVTVTRGVFSRGDTFYVKRENFYPDSG